MDFSKLKELAKNLGGILVMQDNDPEFVVLPWEKYQTPTPAQSTPNHEDDALVDQLNKEIQALKEEIRQKEASEAELI